jgi:phospholipid/cholesterol/gamma-HCH transport system substrate-binding protein
MATAAQKVKVGVFLVACGIILAIGLVAITGFHRAPTKTYYIEFEGSVSGLNAGSVVQYMGVEVGKVEDVVVSQDKVRVKISIRQDKGVRLTEGVTAKLDMLGISGLVFIQLLPGGIKNTAELDEGATIPALSSSIVERATDIMVKLSDVLTNLEKGELKGEMGETVRATRDFLIAAKTSMDNLTATLNSVQATVENANKKVEAVDVARINADIHDALVSIKDLSAQLNKTAETLNKAVPAAQREMAITQQELEMTLQQMREAMSALEQLAKALEEDPSALFHGKSKREE